MPNVATAIGTLWYSVDNMGALLMLGFDASDDPNHSPRNAEVERQLIAYARGELQTFSLPLAPKGTEFQQQVWAELLKIPFGTTTTYGAIAKTLGDEKLTRAVGAANGANPIAIVIPCHRVIGSNGNLTGYAGGLDKKEMLLIHEGALTGRLL